MDAGEAGAPPGAPARVAADAVRPGLVPPQSLEAERSVLGQLLVNNSAWEAVDGVITAEDFYDAGHRLVFECVRDLMDEGMPADLITVAKRLRDHGKLDRVGGADGLADLTQILSGGENLKGHARIIRDSATLRELISVTKEIGEHAYRPGGDDPRQVIDMAESRLLAVSERQSQLSRGYQAIGKFGDQVMDMIDRLSRRTDKTEVIGTPTGFYDLDRLTSGLQVNELAIIAGRPSMGKTSLALDIARHVADRETRTEHGNGVMMFSLEMSGEQLMTRMLGNVGEINYHKLRTGDLTEREMDKLVSVMGQIERLSLYIDDTGDIDIMQIRARARRVYRELKKDGQRLSLVIVDYLQLVRGNSVEGESRTQEVSSITRGLKSLAKELGVTVVALSQLNRALETRPNRRPILADLRESGAIEQDADLIMFLYRESAYNPEVEDETLSEIIVGKHRNGPTGNVKVTFLKQYASFRNRAMGQDD